jgi:nicotinamide-nucleotide amidase
MKRIANDLVKTLQEKKLTLALAESVTCGQAAHQLSLVKGTGDVLQGGIICYDEKVKCGLLKVSKRLIEKHTAESQRVTDELAKNLKLLLKADIYGAITGLADKGGSESKSKPVGTIYLSIYYKRKFYRRKKLFRGSPLAVTKKACKALYEFILETVKA